MTKTIKTGKIPLIGQREADYTWTVTVKLNRKEIEGCDIGKITDILEAKLGPVLIRLIAEADLKAKQWAAETEQTRKFLEHDN